jgi:hypothetical protein
MTISQRRIRASDSARESLLLVVRSRRANCDRTVGTIPRMVFTQVIAWPRICGSKNGSEGRNN